MKRFVRFTLTTMLCLTSAAVFAQEPVPAGTPIVLDERAGYDSVPKPLTTAQLRQQIALEKKRQRIARMEHNAWMGYSPARPTVSDMPMMRSNYVYPLVRFLYVPVVVR